MESHIDDSVLTQVWFVGASGSEGDYAAKFISEGIWENGYTDRHLDDVRSMKPGDRIAIKSAYTRKHGLPFDNRGLTVSVMAIKAIGTIAENFGDGRRVRVSWTKVQPPREWYFNTHRGTIWRVEPGEWMADGLIDFAFNNGEQDVERFQNAPFWKPRFGTRRSGAEQFSWTRFYEAMADSLLQYRRDRTTLVAALKKIAERIDGLGYLAEDQYAGGGSGFVRDICPFTLLGAFNRGTTEANRKAIAAELARFLKVTEPVPNSFEGIPLLNNQRTWFFPLEVDRASDHIDSLWDVFAAAIDYAKSADDESRRAFANAYDAASGRFGVAWNLTFGCYWIRPWDFASLDSNSRKHVEEVLRLTIGRRGPKRRSNAADYLAIIETLMARFQEPAWPVHSFPELSLAAWQADPADDSTQVKEPHASTSADVDDDESVTPQAPAPLPPYAIDDIRRDGAFLSNDEISDCLSRLREKGNLILQGPPGTGKTWLAKRLAFALIGRKDDKKIWPVQFHPNLSYEDFVQGWRPGGDGKLSLVDGILLNAVEAARKDAHSKFVVVIEEINRGNPAQIFGEMLTLIEAAKRTPDDALFLSYSDAEPTKRRRVYIPKNLYIIGTMNLADRSLALVDFALRRRFAFVNLSPLFGIPWRTWVIEQCGMDANAAGEIARKMTTLNIKIENDSRLGKQFCIGHSYVTPVERLENGASATWFAQVVKSEIQPLLDEYWFDSKDESAVACADLQLTL